MFIMLHILVDEQIQIQHQYHIHYDVKIRITKMFAVLFTLFVLGYHPYGFVRAYKRRPLHPDIFVLLTLLYCVSICASPFVYGIMNNQLRHECMRVIFNCWHCQRIDDYKKYSHHHRLNSAVTQALTVGNGTAAGGGGGGDDGRASPSMASMRNFTCKSTEKKASSLTVLDTACV